MKIKLLSILIVLGFLVSGFSVVGQPDSDSVQMRERITIEPISLSIQSETYSVLSIEGSGKMNTQENSYQTPVQTLTYTYAEGTIIEDISIIPTQTYTQKLDYPLQATPTAQPLSVEFSVENEENVELKALDEWYSYRLGHGLINFHERGIILDIELHPLLYNSDSMSITLAESFDVEITTTQTAPQPTPSKENYDLLILTGDDFSNELQNLVLHKNSIGTATKMVTLSEIQGGTYFTVEGRDSAEQVKYFIKNAIDQWNIAYVLLVGHSTVFPVRSTHIRVSSSDTEQFVSDLYFADIYDSSGNFSSWDTNENNLFCEYEWGSERNTDEGIDFYPDVLFGRLPAYQDEEVELVVEKIIAYEENEAYTQDWFTNLLVGGGDTFPGDDDGISEGEYTNEKIMNIMDTFSFDIFWASNGRLSGVAPSGVQKLKDGINAGCGFIDLSGHGNTRSWATHPFENSNSWLPQPTQGFLNSQVRNLENGDALPIVVTGACSVAKYNANVNTFCWAFLAAEDGGGIASFGCSALGYGYLGRYVTEGLIGKMELDIFKAFAREGASTIGELLVSALNDYIEPNMGPGDIKMVTEYHLFGDPSVRIGEDSTPPNTPERPTGPADGSFKDTHEFTTSSVDPDLDDLYYQFDWGDGTYSAWVGPYDSGEQISVEHKWDERGDYQVRVKCKDTHGKQSDWSAPSVISLPRVFEFSDILEMLFDLFPNLEPLYSWVVSTFAFGK